MPNIKGVPLSKRQQFPRFRTKAGLGVVTSRKVETRVSTKRPSPAVAYSTKEARDDLTAIWGRGKAARSYLRRNGARLLFVRAPGEKRVETLARLAGVNVSDLEFQASTRRELFDRITCARLAEVNDNQPVIGERPANPFDRLDPTVSLTEMSTSTAAQATASDYAKSDAQSTTALKLAVPPIHVRVIHESTNHEGGSDGGAYGDVLVRLHHPRCNRFTLASQLHDLASHISNTIGDPIEGADIHILMRRPRP